MENQKEVSVGANGDQLSDGRTPSPAGTIPPEPGFTNPGSLGNGY